MSIRDCLLALGTLASSALAAPAPEQLGRSIEDFSLQDFRGKQHALADIEAPLVVVAFLGTECPLAKLYGTRLSTLADEYRDRGVEFVGIHSNRQDSITEIAAYARRHAVSFPQLKDPGNRVADQFGAIRTPEVFVLDAARVVRYWGRINDQYGVGYVRQAPTQQDLQEALDDLLSGEPVGRSVTEAVGCHIGRIRSPEPDSPVNYSQHVAPILQQHCVECHRTGEIAPFTLTDYDEVVGWADTIEEVIRDQRMPPWHAEPSVGKFANARVISETEKQTVYDWIAHGAP